MEYLHTILSACLERYGVLPKEISYGILRDVALGHDQQIQICWNQSEVVFAHITVHQVLAIALIAL